MYIYSVPVADIFSGDRRSRRPKQLNPHGLCLTVFLSPDSFLPMHEEGSTKVALNDVKIDVFFNGELCGSSIVAECHHGNGHQMTEHIVRFSGRKIGNMVEKPWVIVPPGQNADGTLRKHHQGEKAYAGAQPRWAALSEALEAEARRVGCDELGELSLLGEYLITLAQREMPPEVEEMQNAEGPQFGVIDVVVIVGKSQKDDATTRKIIDRPTAMRLKANKPEVRQYWMNPPKDYYGRNTIPQTMSDEDVKAMELRHALLKSTIESYGRKMQHQNTATASSKHDEKHDIAATASSILYESTSAPDDNMTLSEEFDSLLAKTKQSLPETKEIRTPVSRIALASRSGLADRGASTLAGPSKILKTNVEKPKLTVKLKTGPGLAPSTAPQTRPITSASASSPPDMTLPLPWPAAELTTLRKSDDWRPNVDYSLENPWAWDKSWSTPPLSQDSVLTYAAGGLLRSVKSERSGWFEEKDVVMGARLLVGYK